MLIIMLPYDTVLNMVILLGFWRCWSWSISSSSLVKGVRKFNTKYQLRQLVTQHPLANFLWFNLFRQLKMRGTCNILLLPV
jgi:hypothetical protein